MVKISNLKVDCLFSTLQILHVAYWGNVPLDITKLARKLL